MGPGSRLASTTRGCGWHLPSEGRDAAAEFAAAHIPGAQFFDIDRIADRTSELPHMLPGAADFAAALGAMGIASDDRVVVYDGAGLMSAPCGPTCKPTPSR